MWFWWVLYGFCMGFVWFCWWQKVLELLFLLYGRENWHQCSNIINFGPLLLCCFFQMAGIYPFVDTVAAQSVQLSRKVSGLFQSCFCIPEISSHAPLACSWSAPTATSAAKWMCYKIPAVLLNCCHRKPESAELLLNIPNLGPLKNELSYFKPLAPKKSHRHSNFFANFGS